MVVGKISDHFNENQKSRARLMMNILQLGSIDPVNTQADELMPLYDGNDNACTYAMTGLLTHLLRAIIGNGNVYASSYTNEKIELIEGEVK